MLKELNEINTGMVEFGCSLLGKSLYDLTFASMGGECVHPYAYSGIIQALEILMKAAIAEKHPLLIYEKIPKLTSKKNQLDEFFKKARSRSFLDLPDLLALTTNYQIECKLLETAWINRCKIIHIGHNLNLDYTYSGLDLTFKIIDPFIYTFWKRSSIDETTSFDSETPIYLVEHCLDYDIDFKIHKGLITEDDEIFPRLNDQHYY
ncbi:TPA: hypothetical protein OUZ74_000223 [Legionella pneumophila]|nr:hypothetical protein [Legionella pneumophila]